MLTWSATKKRHASLRAGVSTAELMLIGGEGSQIEFRPVAHVPVMDAVEALASGFSRTSIRTGDYPSAGIAKMGPTRWARLERAVRPHRGSPVLDLLCHVARSAAPDTEDSDMYDEGDLQAARILALLARGSSLRANRGLEFWGGTFARRVERIRRLPLSTGVSKLMRLIDCSTTSPATSEVLAVLGGMDPDDVASIEAAIRDRTALVVALAFNEIKGRSA